MVDYSQKGLKKCSKAWLSAQVHRISDSDLQPLLDCQLMLETTGTDWGGELEVSKCFAGALSTWWSSLLPWWRPRSLFIMPVWYTEDLCLRFKTGDLVGTLFFFFFEISSYFSPSASLIFWDNSWVPLEYRLEWTLLFGGLSSVCIPFISRIIFCCCYRCWRRCRSMTRGELGWASRIFLSHTFNLEGVAHIHRGGLRSLVEAAVRSPLVVMGGDWWPC